MEDPIHLFAYFTGNGEDGMRLAVSRDGLTWEPTAQGRALIRPERGLMRDPFLLRGPDQRFHLLWTTDWESQDIGYASSENLTDWSPQRRLPVMASVKGARNCWAPEMAFDEREGTFVVFWASTVSGRFPETAGSSESDYNHRMWYAVTKDFQTLSPPKVFFDPGFNVIDATLVRDDRGGRYRLIAKDETLHPVAKNLFHCEADSILGPYSPPSEPFTQSWVEGPAALAVDGFTYVYFDQYQEKRYGAVRTRDFRRWEDVSDRVSFPAGARHGSVLTITSAEFRNLQASLP